MKVTITSVLSAKNARKHKITPDTELNLNTSRATVIETSDGMTYYSDFDQSYKSGDSVFVIPEGTIISDHLNQYMRMNTFTIPHKDGGKVVIENTVIHVDKLYSGGAFEPGTRNRMSFEPDTGRDYSDLLGVSFIDSVKQESDEDAFQLESEDESDEIELEALSFDSEIPVVDQIFEQVDRLHEIAEETLREFAGDEAVDEMLNEEDEEQEMEEQ